MSIKDKLEELKHSIATIYLAMNKPETPWIAKFMAFLTVGYALSPIDLIPDFIPVLGYLDDLIILPILAGLTIKLIPEKIWLECETESRNLWKDGKPKKWYYALPIILVWIVFLVFLLSLLKQFVFKAG